MKNIFTLLLLLIVQISFAQSPQHKPVVGTSCFLIPPKGFVEAHDFWGFQNTQKQSSILFLELDGQIDSMLMHYKPLQFKAISDSLLIKHKTKGTNHEGMYYLVHQNVNGAAYEKQLFVFGDSAKTIYISAKYPMYYQKIAKEVKAAILSVVYNPKKKKRVAVTRDKPAYITNAKYGLDISSHVFQFAKDFAGTLVYTTDAKMPTQSTDGAMLVLAQSFGKMDAPNKEQFCINRLQQLPHKDSMQIEEIKPVTIDGLSGYEITAFTQNAASEKELVYQLILFEKNSYYILVGNCYGQFENYALAFKKHGLTFKRK
jgi:hypothetical protein